MKSAGAKSLVFSPSLRYEMLFTVLVSLSMAAAKISLSTLTRRGLGTPERGYFIVLASINIFVSATFLK